MEPLPKLNVLLFQRDGFWVAVGLEHFFAGQGKTIREAVVRFLNDVAGQLLLDAEVNEPPLQETPPAPQEYWERYRASEIKLSIDLSSLVLGVLPVLDVLGDIRMAA